MSKELYIFIGAAKRNERYASGLWVVTRATREECHQVSKEFDAQQRRTRREIICTRTLKVLTGNTQLLIHSAADVKKLRLSCIEYANEVISTLRPAVEAGIVLDTSVEERESKKRPIPVVNSHGEIGVKVNGRYFFFRPGATSLHEYKVDRGQGLLKMAHDDDRLVRVRQVVQDELGVIRPLGYVDGNMYQRSFPEQTWELLPARIRKSS